jgi:hypothetical protein
MGLDAHLGKTARKSKFQFGMEIQTHQGIMGNHHVRNGKVKLILRIKDYYADCSFENHELAELVAELKLLESSYPKEHMTLEFLEMFRKVCEEGLVNNLNLYFFCD